MIYAVRIIVGFQVQLDGNPQHHIYIIRKNAPTAMVLCPKAAPTVSQYPPQVDMHALCQKPSFASVITEGHVRCEQFSEIAGMRKIMKTRQLLMTGCGSIFGACDPIL